MSAVLARQHVVSAAGLLIVAALMSACSSSKPSPTASPAPALPSPAAPGGSALWGDLKPVVSVKELMRDMLDPASDYIFDAVRTVTTKKGARSKQRRRRTPTGTRSASARSRLPKGSLCSRFPGPSPRLETRTTAPAPTRRNFAGADQGQARGRPGALECQNRGAAKRRPRGPRDCEDRKTRTSCGTPTRISTSLRELPCRLLVSRRRRPAQEARSPFGGTVRAVLAATRKKRTKPLSLSG